MRPTWNQLRPAEHAEQVAGARRKLAEQRLREADRKAKRRAKWSELQRAYWHATHCQRFLQGGHGAVTDEARQFYVDRYREAVGFSPLECGCEER